MSGRDAVSDRAGRAKVAAVGDSVKVERNRERFWVKVTRVCEGTIHGWVDNDLRQNPELQYGDSIALQPADVLEVARPVDFALVRQRAEQLQALWSYGCHPFISHHKAVQRAALEWWDQRLEAKLSAPARPTAAYFLQTKIKPQGVPEALGNVSEVVRY